MPFSITHMGKISNGRFGAENKKSLFWEKQELIPNITERGAVGGGYRLVDHRFIIPTLGGICKGECSAAPARKGPQGAKV